jgi:hypothetical protein
VAKIQPREIKAYEQLYSHDLPAPNTVEVWTARGLKRFLVLFFIDLSTRRVEVAGIASNANGLWMNQIGRRVTDAVDGILQGNGI